MGNNIIKNQFALQYMFGGKSEFVIENIITHNRFLYQIKQAQNNKKLYFVINISCYRYRTLFRFSKKLKLINDKKFLRKPANSFQMVRELSAMFIIR